MKIAVWRTCHEIADRVAAAVYFSLLNYGHETFFASTKNAFDENTIKYFDYHIGYGILRGMDEVFRACDKAGKPWFNIDKGYWKPGHYDGYYRVSLRGTQQTTGLDKIEPDYARWDALGIEIFPEHIHTGYSLICPPSDFVCEYFCIDEDQWIKIESPKAYRGKDHFQGMVRRKGDARCLPIDWRNVNQVITFNSSVGWEALRQGIPVVSDPTHSIVGAYQKLIDKSLHIDRHHTRALFSVMAGLQLTLDEMRQGKLWPLMQTLLSCTSASTAEKQ